MTYGGYVLGVFLDSETNGLNPRRHRIAELAYKIVDLTTGELIDQYETLVSLSKEDFDKSDPESLKVNHFRFEELLSRGKDPQVIAQEITDQFAKHKIQRKKAVFICQNPSFDRVFFSQLVSPEEQEKLLWPDHWLDLASMYWALAIQKARNEGSAPPWETGFSKDMIAARYKIAPENRPHRAMNGVSHLLLCYETVVGFPKKN